MKVRAGIAPDACRGEEATQQSAAATGCVVQTIYARVAYKADSESASNQERLRNLRRPPVVRRPPPAAGDTCGRSTLAVPRSAQSFSRDREPTRHRTTLDGGELLP